MAQRRYRADRAHRRGGAHPQQRADLHRRQAASSWTARIASSFERALVAGMAALAWRPHGRGDAARAARHAGYPRRDRPAVRRSVEMGARLLTGGKRLDRPGNYYAPTVLADVPKGAPAYSEETFGPVRCSTARMESKSRPPCERHRVRAGRQACGPTTKPSRGRFIDEIEVGMVFINGMVVSDLACVRGAKPVGVRTRAGRLRHPRIREREDGAGGLVRSTPAPAPAAGSNPDTCRR